MIEIREPGQIFEDERLMCEAQVCMEMPSSCPEDCDDHLCGAPATHALGVGLAFCRRHWEAQRPVVITPWYREWWEAHFPKPVAVAATGVTV